MAFLKKYLHKIESLGMGGTLWCYDTADAAADVAVAAYFNGEGSEHIRLGDLMLVRTWDDLATPTSVTMTLHFVNAAGATIDLADALAITATDAG